MARVDGRLRADRERDLWSEPGRGLPTFVLAAFIVTLRMQIAKRAHTTYVH